MKRTEISDGTRWESDRGSLEASLPAPNVVVFVEQGFLVGSFAPHIVNTLNGVLSKGIRPHIFVDCYDLVGYDSEVRVASTNWLKQHRDDVVCQHMLVRSKLTKMGLSVASLALGGVLVGHSTRASFDAELQSVVRKSVRPHAGA